MLSRYIILIIAVLIVTFIVMWVTAMLGITGLNFIDSLFVAIIFVSISTMFKWLFHTG